MALACPGDRRNEDIDQMAARAVRTFDRFLCKRDDNARGRGHDEVPRLMEQALTRLALSARAYHRILKVARTIADLQGAESIDCAHLSEAIGYRRLDRGAPAP